MANMSGIAGMLAQSGADIGRQIGAPIAGVGQNIGGMLAGRADRKRQQATAQEVQQLLKQYANNTAQLNSLGQKYDSEDNNEIAKLFYDAAKAATAKEATGQQRGVQGGLMAITQGASRGVPLADLQDAARSVLAQGGTQAQITEAYKAGITIAKGKTGDGDYRKSDEVIIRDSKGNKFSQYSIQDIDNPTSTPVIKYVPIGDGPDKPVGAITIISQRTGAGAFDQPEIARDVKTEQDFAELKVDATAQLPELMSQSRILDDAVAALDTMESQGLPEVIVDTIFSEFGAQDPDIAEYEMLVGELMYARLKPLFGGVISEGEREAIVGLYADMKRGEPANKRILMQLKRKIEETIVKANLIRRADSFDDYNMSLDRMYPTEEEKTEQNVVDFSTLPTQG